MSQYCAPADVTTYALPPAAVAAIPIATQLAQCVAASERMDSYMRGRFQLPLLAWGQDVIMHAAYIAAALLMRQRGYNPAAGADVTIERRYAEAIAWCEGVERQRIHPDVTPSPSPGTNYQLPQVSTGPVRGWQLTDRTGRSVV
jgi:phage gp36-like protein